MATPVDPILTAIERDRIAYVAFVTSVNRTDEGKAAQERATSRKPKRTPAKPPVASRRMLLVKPRNDGVGVRARRSVLPLAEPSRE
jgi:hypothetical protein